MAALSRVPWQEAIPAKSVEHRPLDTAKREAAKGSPLGVVTTRSLDKRHLTLTDQVIAIERTQAGHPGDLRGREVDEIEMVHY
jgi:hypothetical protein